MFGIGLWEIILIAVLAVILIRPKDMPGIARKAGFWIGKIRRMYDKIEEEIEKGVNDDRND